jgi:hypothetical protein
MNNKKSLLDLDRKVKNLLLYKKNIHRNSTRSKILDMMHPNIKLTIRQIVSKIDKPHDYTKKIILQMQSDEYLFSNGKKIQQSISFISDWQMVCIVCKVGAHIVSITVHFIPSILPNQKRSK